MFQNDDRALLSFKLSDLANELGEINGILVYELGKCITTATIQDHMKHLRKWCGINSE